MRSLALLCFVFGLAVATDPFLLFKNQHGKQYKSLAEYKLRRSIFMDNFEKMKAHNARFAEGKESWYMKVNPFYDLTQEEFTSAFVSGIPSYDKDSVFEDTIDEAFQQKVKAAGAAPDSFSWVDEGGVSPVQNQAQCGSCAAFATVATLESCFGINNGYFDDLSEQHIVSCANGHVVNDGVGSWGAYGCDGAWPIAYMDWIINYNGGKIQTEASYPYTSGNGNTGSCHPASNGDYSGTITGVNNQWFVDENQVKNVIPISPVTTTILAANGLFGYGGGVLEDPSCCDAVYDSDCVYNLNHEVTIVGYGNESGKDFWLIKNSWGAGWGDRGFFKIKRGTGHCGVASLHFLASTCA